MNKLLAGLRRTVALSFDRIGRRFGRRFYLAVALIASVAAVADFLTTHVVVGMRNGSFDAMVRNRLRVPRPSGDIVIVDIDEKSLAAMAPEFGRWPWPRQVFGEFVEKLNAQKPGAIVFDIMFSDPDVYNGESDAYFDEVIGAAPNTWFPMIRLPLTADSASRLRAAQVPGARPLDPHDSMATIAVILPFLRSVQESGRMGFNNIVPDPDGVSREYPVRYNEHGYEIASLPLAVARALNPSVRSPDRILLNWRGKPFTYHYVSFADVYGDMRLERPSRPADEFAGRIVIIGSTAPSLFDIKVTALDKQFPGVEILATAIDNMRSGDWLKVPDIPFAYFLITLSILWMTALGFYRRGTGGRLDRFYGFTQFILIGIAYSAINLFDLYLNLTGPVMFGFAYYSVARYYAFATARALDTSVVQTRVEKGGQVGCMLLLRFNMPTREETLIARLAGILLAGCSQQPSAEWLHGKQSGMWRLLENTLVLCWRAEAGDQERLSAVREEAEKIQGSMRELLGKKPLAGVLPFDCLAMNYTEAPVGRGEHKAWQRLLAESLAPGKSGGNT